MSIPTPTTYTATPAPITSPWGMVEDAKEIAPGIWRVSTMSHGGFYLSPERQLKMPARLAEITWLKNVQWFEEDVDAAWVVLAFPDLFKDSDVRAARYMLSAYTDGRLASHKNSAAADIAREAMDLLAAANATGG